MATYEDWKVGDLAVRKSRLCRVKKIHFDENPPHVTVEMLDDDNEVGTEFSKLRHATSEEIESVKSQNSEGQSHETPDIKNSNIDGRTKTDTDYDTESSIETETRNKNITNSEEESEIPQRETLTKNNANIKNTDDTKYTKKAKMETYHNIDNKDDGDSRSNVTTDIKHKTRSNAGYARNAMNSDKNNNNINGKTKQRPEIHSSPSLQKPSTKTQSPKRKHNRYHHPSQRDRLFDYDSDDWVILSNETTKYNQ